MAKCWSYSTLCNKGLNNKMTWKVWNEMMKIYVYMKNNWKWYSAFHYYPIARHTHTHTHAHTTHTYIYIYIYIPPCHSCVIISINKYQGGCVTISINKYMNIYMFLHCFHKKRFCLMGNITYLLLQELKAIYGHMPAILMSKNYRIQN